MMLMASCETLGPQIMKQQKERGDMVKMRVFKQGMEKDDGENF